MIRTTWEEMRLLKVWQPRRLDLEYDINPLRLMMTGGQVQGQGRFPNYGYQLNLWPCAGPWT